MLFKKNYLNQKNKILISLLFPFFLFVIFLLFPQPTQAATYKYRGISFYAYTDKNAAENLKPVYKFYSSKRKDWYYSTSESQKERAIKKGSFGAGYKYKGIAFYAYDDSDAAENLKPVYRYYSSKRKDSYYDASESKKDKIIKMGKTKAGYKYTKISFYAYSDKDAAENLKPVYKFYSKSKKDWRYTASEDERDTLTNGSYGKSIKVGIQYRTPVDLRDESYRIKANKDYIIKDQNGNIIAEIDADDRTKIKYDEDGKLKIYDSLPESVLVNKKVFFEAADGNNLSMIFNVYHAQYRYGDYYENYRGKIKVQYSKTYDNCVIRFGTNHCGSNRSTGEKASLVWVINEVPLEHYTWGMGEITGTGPMEYNKLMTTVYRTYGYWWYKKGTKYSDEGFDLRSNSGNQIYSGYDWEKSHPRIKEGAQSTRGKIIKYGSKIALTPYSSWTDGKTRSFKQRWGSSSYPWCQSVSDPYGNYNGKYWNNSSRMSTSELVATGNHMVGISAHGALTLAYDKGWSWKKILDYYITNVRTVKAY